MTEAWVDQFNKMLWSTGAADNKGVHGIMSMLGAPSTPTASDPTSGDFGTVAGINSGTSTWWKHRHMLNATTSPTNGGALMQFLHSEIRQLRRYGGKPRYALCGSDFLEALETEMRANGQYSDSGFASGGDISVGSIKHKGIEFMYDPTLDEFATPSVNTLGTGNVTGAKGCLIFDPDRLRLRPMQGEDMKRHSPARPEGQYLAYAAVTWTGTMDMTQRNCHGYYSIA